MDQCVDLAQHGIKFFCQCANFICRDVFRQQGAGCCKVTLLLVNRLHRFAQSMDWLCDKARHMQKHPCKQKQNRTFTEYQGISSRIDLAIDFMVVKYTA